MTHTKPAHQINYSSFLRFHPSANGTDGRPVYIDPALLTRFVELIDPSSHIGKQVIQGLIGLKNSAAGISSDSNQSNALQHRSTFQNIVATYTVLQHGGGEGRESTLQIWRMDIGKIKIRLASIKFCQVLTEIVNGLLNSTKAPQCRLLLAYLAQQPHQNLAFQAL